MTTIKNINEKYGDQILFKGDNLKDALCNMANAALSIWRNNKQDVRAFIMNLTEDVDYEIVEK